MKQKIKNMVYDQERALYNLRDTALAECTFAGPADGESALKEARNITMEDCSFSLRYPLWHTEGFRMTRCRMDEGCRAAIWYSTGGTIADSQVHGIKALRECRDITLKNSSIQSPEFGWKCRGIALEDCRIQGEYLFLDSREVRLEGVEMTGKYSFQYMEDLQIRNSNLNTKDAFWHSRNVTVTDSVLRGEYLGWYSENLTLIRCNIIGTQPLCYCKGLKLIDCTMEQTDLCFEYSQVDATITGHVDSVKNPLSGTITLDSVGEIIRDHTVTECTGRVIIR